MEQCIDRFTRHCSALSVLSGVGPERPRAAEALDACAKASASEHGGASRRISVSSLKRLHMENSYSYDTRLDIKYNHLELIDVPAIVKANQHKWFNQTLTQVNNSVVRVAIVEGEYHWHKHDNDDEFFFVLEGQLLIDLEDKTIALNPWEGFTISKGIVHRTRALKKTV